MCMAVISIPIVLEAHYHLNFYYLLSDSFIDIIGGERRWDASDYGVVKLLYSTVFYQILSVVLAAMMVLPIPMLSLKFHGLKWKENMWRYGIFIWVVLCYIIFVIPYTDFLPFEIGLIDYLIWPIFILGYFVLSWIYAIFDAPKTDTNSNEIPKLKSTSCHTPIA